VPLVAIIALERMDTWVWKVSIAIPVLCLAALFLWHLVSFLAGNLFKKPRTYRKALEPRPPRLVSGSLPAGSAQRGPPGSPDDPERLQEACASLVNSLADLYLELAECWWRRGEPQRAAAALHRLMQTCPETSQAQLAQDRLRRMDQALLPPS
jgi:hypothetical protein